MYRFSVLYRITLSVFTFFLMLNSHDAFSQIPLFDSEKLFLTGDIRAGYIGVFGENRDGSQVETHELRNRSRLGLMFIANDRLSLHLRYAIRLSSRDFSFEPGLSTTAPGNGGLRMGEGAFDEAFLRYRFSDKFLVQLGRFQTAYTLDGVISNAIIRHDSPSMDVGWTDGAMLGFKPSPGWNADIVLQWHHENSPTNIFRYPLDTENADTPLAMFTNIRRSFEDNIVRDAGINILWSPDALITSEAGERSDYFSASYKTTLGWDLKPEQVLLWSSEIAYSFTRPYETLVNLGDDPDERAGGFGIQSNLSIMNLFPGHNLGFIAASIAPSLLTSADYWQNSLLVEMRHQYRANKRLSFETRLRYRQDQQQLVTEEQVRWQIYPYVRFTYRFR